jgi:hypothetical protein
VVPVRPRGGFSTSADEEEYRRRRTELLCDHEDAGMMATAHVYG